jgi:hypothetical protein
VRGELLACGGDARCLNLTSGVQFDFYADVNRGVHKSVVAIATAHGEDLDQYLVRRYSIVFMVADDAVGD